MPLFEFQCPKCRRVIELLFPSAEAADARRPLCISPLCPAHRRAVMTRIPSVAGFVLKGPGFHVNDYHKP